MRLSLTKNHFCLIDDEDYEKIKDFRWKTCISKTQPKPYASSHRKVGNKKYREILLHRFLMGLSFGEKKFIDHINGDTLDNRKSNLRICTPQQNQMNRNKNKGTNFKGVWWANHAKKWCASIQINRKRSHLGYFKNEKEAALAYNKEAIKLFGEFARINQIKGKV